jgi:hypothetical protein
MRSLAILAVAAVCAAADIAAADDEAPDLLLRAGLGYHYSSGDYGDRESTHISYVPLIVRSDIEAWTLELTLPYIAIRGPSGIFGVIDGNQNAGNEDVERKQGPGDILLSAAYTLWPWWERMPFLTATGRIKFPTASESDGLGTGEFDFYVSGQATWAAGAYTPFIEIGYEALGDSSQVNLHDAVQLSTGLSYKLLEALNLGFSFDYGSPTSSSAGQRIDLVPFLYWNLTPAWALGGYGSAGLADGSPDVGVGVQLSYDIHQSRSSASAN